MLVLFRDNPHKTVKNAPEPKDSLHIVKQTPQKDTTKGVDSFFDNFSESNGKVYQRNVKCYFINGVFRNYR